MKRIALSFALLVASTVAAGTQTPAPPPPTPPAVAKPDQAKPAPPKPAPEKPAPEKPATEKPATEKPATEKPAPEKSATEKAATRPEPAAPAAAPAATPPSGGIAAPKGEVLEQILVKVNGDIITKTELEQRQIGALRQRDPNFRPGSDAELQKALVEVTPEVIVNAIDELLLVQRGRELGYALGNDQFRKIVEDIKKENNLDTEEKFLAALKTENLTLEDLRKQLERQMLVSRVQQVEVAGKIAVTDEEVKNYYESAKESFTTQPQLTLREILVNVPTSDKGVNVAEDDAAKAKAEDLRKRIEAGESFEKLASEVSDSGSKANGGLIGPIARTDLSPELLKEIDPLKPGQMTRVLRTGRGYQIVKLESATATKVQTMEEARPDIAEKVAGQKQRGQMVQYLQQLRAQAIIDWKNDEIKKAYEAGVKQQQSNAQSSNP